MEDFLARRSRIAFLDVRAAKAAVPRVAQVRSGAMEEWGVVPHPLVPGVLSLCDRFWGELCWRSELGNTLLLGERHIELLDWVRWGYEGAILLGGVVRGQSYWPDWFAR